MYKPRIVEFETASEWDGIRRVDTRKGSKGFYPGDEVLFNDFLGTGHRKALVVGVRENGTCLQYIDEFNRIWGNAGWMFDLSNSKLIKRHATPKLIKQMKQI
jgi:hypothetical protein